MGIKKMKKVSNLILGAGIAGLATGRRLAEIGQDYLILEKESYAGGLCAGFSIDGFDFDYFVHMSFTKNELVRRYFDIVPFYTHIPNPYNYYHGKWIKHPAINNLSPLSREEKDMVLDGLAQRDRYVDGKDDNYENWLRYQFGDYFAEHFPLCYNRKFWCVEACDMETSWAGTRVYQPSMEEITEGMETEDTPITYYSKEMRYPIEGGFRSYLYNIIDKSRINYDERVISIDLGKKLVKTDREEYSFKKLFSSIPVTELGSILEKPDKSVIDAISSLHWTGGYLVSLGIKGKKSRDDLWDYIYDTDIIISRFYSPSVMSAKCAPEGCYSIQAEIYTKDGKPHELGSDCLLDKAISQLDQIGVINKSDVIVKDIRFSKYCNIIFGKDTYEKNEIVQSYLKNNGVIPIGRFGEWEYYWSDQSFMSGYSAIDKAYSRKDEGYV